VNTRLARNTPFRRLSIGGAYTERQRNAASIVKRLDAVG